jgi:hypothetical protein
LAASNNVVGLPTLFEPEKHCLSPANIVWSRQTMKKRKKQCSAPIWHKKGSHPALPQSGIIVVYNPGEDKETFDAPES